MALGEIEKGIPLLDEGKRRREINHWYENDLQARFAGRILAIGTGVAGQYSGDYNSGSGWDISKNGSGNSDFTVKPFLMQVDAGSSTPEPGTWYGALGGLAAIMATRLRRRV